MTEPVRIELPTIFGMKTVNTFLFLEPEPVLIDCGEGTADGWDALVGGLQEHGLTIRDLKKVYITHAHVDHIGLAARIATESNAEIWVNEFSYEWAYQPKELWAKRSTIIHKNLIHFLPASKQQTIHSLQHFSEVVTRVWPAAARNRLSVFSLHDTIKLGGQDWQVVYTPGHSNTQTCFYQPDHKWLLSADALLRIAPTPVLDFDPNNPSKREKSLPIMIQTMQMLVDMDIQKVFPGHYEPFGNHREVLQRQLSRIDQRQEEVFLLIKNGKNQFLELFDHLYGNRMNLPGMFMLIGYLDLLRDSRRISVVRQNDHFVFMENDIKHPVNG